MLIKNFNSFIVNESAESVVEFLTKVREDLDIMGEVKPILNSSFERLSSKKINTVDDFREAMEDATGADATNLSGFDLDKQLDLCIYAEEEEDGNDKGCPACSFDDLAGIINDNAVNGLNYIVNSYLHPLLDRIESFMNNNNLSYSNIHRFEQYDMLAPLSQKTIVNGSYSIYQEAKEDPKFAEYNYIDEELGTEFYITKMNIK
jgi:hypothetical protein